MRNRPKKICPQLLVFGYHCIFFFFHGKGVIMSKQTIPMKEFQNQ